LIESGITQKQLIEHGFPQYSEIKPALYKNRQKAFPSLPQSLGEFTIEQDNYNFHLNEDGQRFLLADTKLNNDRIVIFSSSIGLEVLEKLKKWHCDGTFKTAPKLFYQFYLIYGTSKGNIMPCAFILLIGKSEAIYKRMINELHEAALGMRLKLEPEMIYVDFELAAIKAFQYYYHYLVNQFAIIGNLSKISFARLQV
jgi:hypothetical protein